MSESENEEYELEKIVRKRVMRNGKIEYLAKWKDYPDDQNTVILDGILRPILRCFDQKNMLGSI